MLDERSRLAKARKIVALVEADRALRGLRVLEVGCGSGFIARELDLRVGPKGSFAAVDVVDVRCAYGFEYSLYSGERLPFDDAAFDVVISNHTIEHVGDGPRQAAHAAEIARVLAPGGLVYFACPNRWFPWEAHYRLPFLGWLPRSLADTYVTATGRGEAFDVYPLSRRGAVSLLRNAGLAVRDRTPEAVVFTLRPGADLGRRRGLLRILLAPLTSLMPTLIVIATKRPDQNGPGQSTSARPA